MGPPGMMPYFGAPGAMPPGYPGMMMPPPGMMPPEMMPAGYFGAPGTPPAAPNATPGKEPLKPIPMNNAGTRGAGGCAKCGGAGCADCCPAFGRFGGCGECCGGGCLSHCRLFGGPGDGGPCWRARIEGVFLDFDVPDSPAVTTTLAGVPQMGISSLDFDDELKFRFSLERRLWADTGLEFVFFGSSDWEDSASVADGAGNLQSPFLLINGIIVAAAPFDNALLHEIAYSSELDNFELNYWMPLASKRRIQCSTMAGLRFLSIEEDFDFSAIDATLNGIMRTHTENFAFGGQLGLMSWLALNEKMSVRFDGKVGALYNSGEQTTDIDVFNNATGAQLLDYSEAAETSKGTFLAELSLAVHMQLTCHAAVYLGYQALWIDELVLAPDQFNPVFPTVAAGRPVHINDNASRLYHGPHAGLELVW
jgi:hypothetical protein